MRVYLIGMPGSGKSTLGKLLAKRLNYHFADLDDLIVTNAGQSITDIFAQVGETAFRKLESEALKDTVRLENTIIATGGGTPCFFDNIDWMNQHGQTIFIDTPLSIIAQRIYHVSSEKQKRPLFAGKSREQVCETLNDMYQKRLPFYRKASFHINESDIKPDLVIKYMNQGNSF